MAVQTVTETVDLQTPDGPMAAVVCRPDDAQSYPGIVVIQEVFGVNENIRSIAQRFAAEGYVAVAPDMFHRKGRLRTVAYGDFQTVGILREGLTDDGVVSDVSSAVAHLRGREDVLGRGVGITGYCFGGRVSFLAACRVDRIEAAAVYYGGGIVPNPARPQPGPAPIEFAERISAPLIGFFGDQDQGIPVAHVDQLRDRLRELGKDAEIILYPGAGHGFFCDDRDSHHPEAAADSWKRVTAFFKRHLKDVVTTP